ncbi:hypothetical protein [Saccharomonospora cyanea]|uniref:Uncharacterized protein n=1 Tax=Saccharomonospora cyanea NA-134 TaxID=882082 RepID=H5XG29_9PSEU|nr:hypothetical protein [Saccharomonospora cyanea]EHR62611.1 hypothetical protein SaccyDRAFT_3784 [Saccharomonospora cyanea NA-134]
MPNNRTNPDLSERPANPGERCTCGRPATVVYLTPCGEGVGYCGLSNVPRLSTCPFCGGGPHEAKCPDYRLMLDADAYGDQAEQAM